MIDLITGHQGVAHISAEQVSTVNNVMMNGYGTGQIVRLKDGTITDGPLSVEVSTGYWRMDGYDMEIQEADTLLLDAVTTPGDSRIDIIFVELLQDIATGVQRCEYVIVQGEPDPTPSEPATPTEPQNDTDRLILVMPMCKCTVHDDDSMDFEDLTIPFDIKAGNPQFIGELADWTALTSDEKAEYNGYEVILTDLDPKIYLYDAGTDTLNPIAGDPEFIGLNSDWTTLSADEKAIYNGFKVILTDLNPSIYIYDAGTDTLNPIAGDPTAVEAAVHKFATSSTAASTTAKVATTTDADLTLAAGRLVYVKFDYANTASSPTLNVDDTGAKYIKGYNTTKPSLWWKAGDTVGFVYDGTYWVMLPTQGQIDQIYSDLPKLIASSQGTSQAVSVKLAALTSAYNGLTDAQKRNAYIMYGTWKFVVGYQGQFSASFATSTSNGGTYVLDVINCKRYLLKPNYGIIENSSDTESNIMSLYA